MKKTFFILSMVSTLAFCCCGIDDDKNDNSHESIIGNKYNLNNPVNRLKYGTDLKKSDKTSIDSSRTSSVNTDDNLKKSECETSDNLGQ